MEQLNDLKNLVMQNLEKNGYLSNIRAQIRSSVFKTIDTQESSNKKGSPFFNENLKIQKLCETDQGQKSLKLIQQTLQFYDMEHTLKIFISEANIKEQPKRKELQETHHVKTNNQQTVLYSLLTKFIENNKNKMKAAPKNGKNMEKIAQMPVQMKEDQSEGELEVEEEIIKNESRRFGESQQFGQSQGYDVTVDSLQLQEYDYYEQIE